MKLAYYQRLKVAEDATMAEIKKSYHSLAMLYHPDTSNDENAEEKFKQLAEAYWVLSDQQRRDQYNLEGDGEYKPHYKAEDIFGFLRESGLNERFEHFHYDPRPLKYRNLANSCAQSCKKIEH